MEYARLYLAIGTASSGASVILGAFAAHALKGRLDVAMLGTFQTAVLYQFFHSLALCLLALWLKQLGRPLTLGEPAVIAGIAFVVGICFFSGSLYGLALGAPRWLGPITPLGGLAFITGWAAFGWSAWRS
ncbi:MAG: DUF423 domain-containing protein [Proteobacteria bacterium]|nr:DUF423 domain-containing protein [Pseudomonadota bacterium]